MDLEKLYKMYNTEDILSSLIEMQICPDRETKDIRIPVAEYFISNLIRYNISDSKENYTWTQFQILRKYGHNCFNPSIANIISKAIKLQNADEETKETFLKTSFMQFKNQVFRGDGYLKQLFVLSNLLYKPFDEKFKEKLGFTYTCCEKVMIYFFKEYFLRASKAFKEKNRITNIIKNLWATVRNRQVLINPSISAGYIFRISREELYKEYGQEEIDNLIDFLGIKIGDSSLRPVGISDFKPLYERPFIDFGRYIYLPLPESTLFNLPKLFHYKFIASNIFEKHTVELYKTNRGDVVERLTMKYLGKFFNENEIYQSLKYPNPDKPEPIGFIKLMSNYCAII